MSHAYLAKKDIIDMDTMQRLSYVNDSSSTSGYSTTSPASNYSPMQSPTSSLQVDPTFLNVFDHDLLITDEPLYNPIGCNDVTMVQTTKYDNNDNNKMEYPAKLEIMEEPTEKFRFRYKSEMHGTHGSLNGASSQRNPRTFPEVQLCNYNGPAVIRCSLFQVNLHSPHSHQLVIRRDDCDKGDPHDAKVSPEDGYCVSFRNMGIIQTAKKYIVKELLDKKRKRLYFELGRNLTTKEEHAICKQTEKEAKDMNLNQVRLCFEAFYIADNGIPIQIAAPIYSRIINNRKSAQTGELRIARLSICTGSVSGGEDMILLVEKVSKKNIKVRFYEMSDDDVVWEAFASFRESDVHHQYAIVCKTPPYKDRDIDRSFEVFIELVRPSDDERSYPPVTFRYKPREVIASRKRRRTFSMAPSRNNSSSSLDSDDLPKPVQEQCNKFNSAEIMEELERLLNTKDAKEKLSSFSDGTLDDFLEDFNNKIQPMEDRTEKDGVSAQDSPRMYFKNKSLEKSVIGRFSSTPAGDSSELAIGPYLQRILTIFQDLRSGHPNRTVINSAAKQISKIFHEHLDNSDTGDSIMHEIIASDNRKMVIHMCQLIKMFQLNDLLNTLLNSNKQTVLHYVCLYNRPHYIRPLLGLGCKSNLQDKRGNTAVHIATLEHNSKCLETFINFDAKLQLNILNDDGFTPLHLTIRDNNDEMVIKMLQFDNMAAAVPNCKDGNNALHMVVQQQNLKLVTFIIEKLNMANVLAARNAAGYTALALAKQISSVNDVGLIIYNTLEKYYKKNNIKDILPIINHQHGDTDDCGAQLVIKEEELSSSSTEDDEIVINEQQEFLTHIKDEFVIDRNMWKKALGSPSHFEKVSKLLNNAEKWKQLASKMNIEYFYMNDAQALLNMMRRNIDEIDYFILNQTLNELDTEIIEIIKRM